MRFKTIGIVSAVVLYGVAFGQITSNPSADTNRYYIPIWGRILDYTGTPVRHQILSLSGAGRESIATEADQDGKFQFQSVEGNKPAFLKVNATSFASTPIDIGILTRGGDIGTIVLQPNRPITLVDGSRTN